MEECALQHVFIIGSRGLPASYGGFETFVSELVAHQKNQNIKYHVACLSQEQHGTHYDYKGADCFRIKVPNLGPARVILYDMMAINYALTLVKRDAIKQPIFIFWAIQSVLLLALLLKRYINVAEKSLSILMGWSGDAPSGHVLCRLISNTPRRKWRKKWI